jgi:hypothetical protein
MHHYKELEYRHMDETIVFELARSSGIYLRHESVEFLDTLAEIKHMQHKFNNSEIYKAYFWDIVSRNGGRIIEVATKKTKCEILEICEKFKNITNAKIKPTSMIPEHELFFENKWFTSEPQVQYFRSLLPTNTVEKQIYFLRLKHVMMKDAVVLYNDEFARLDNGRVINNTVVFSEFIEDIKMLLNVMGCVYQKTGHIEGLIDTKELYDEKKDTMIMLTRRLARNLRKINPNVHFDICQLKPYYSTGMFVKKVFGQFGYRVKAVQKKRFGPNRQSYSIMGFDKDTVHLRNAIAGLNYKTLKPMESREEAVQKFITDTINV